MLLLLLLQQNVSCATYFEWGTILLSSTSSSIWKHFSWAVVSLSITSGNTPSNHRLKVKNDSVHQGKRLIYNLYACTVAWRVITLMTNVDSCKEDLACWFSNLHTAHYQNAVNLSKKMCKQMTIFTILLCLWT